MNKRYLLVCGLLPVALACCGLTASALAAAASRAASGASAASGVWQSPEDVPGIATLNVGSEAQLSVVSCTAPGECAGAGFFTDAAGHIQTFVVDERTGVWDAAQELPGSAALNAGGNLVPNAISCASPGNCAVGGNYTDGSGNIQAWVADEAGGAWHDAEELPGTAALNTGGNAMVNSISCAAPGYCAAGGSYAVPGTDGSAAVAAAFVANDVNGTWSAALEVPGTASYASLTSVSCGSAGDCAAGGDTGTGSAYLVTETSGTWGSAQTVAGTSALSGDQPEVTSVACEASGCDAVGMTGAFSGEGFGVAEAGGWGSAWGNAVALPLPVTIPSGDYGALQPQSLSCTSPGNCAAGGFYAIETSAQSSVDQEGVIASVAGGTWGAPQTVPSLVALDGAGSGSVPSVSCSAPGDCAAVGLYGNGDGTHAAVLSETGGTWGTAQPISSVPGEAVSQSISCGAVAYCSIGGGYSADGQYYQAIVADETPVLSTATAESLSASHVTYGREQAEKVSVAVTAALGVVTGTVSVTSDGKRACTITLADGKGACRIPAAGLGAGSQALTARYGGVPGFAASSSAARRLAVVKATSRVTLTLSAARVRYGHERAEQMTVRVLPQYAGQPGGTVVVTAGRARLCVISLRDAAGSCRLGARALRSGTYQVLATYRGDPDYKASASATKLLAITR
jgi:hypothetical protein